ncbi:Glycosyltransferase [Quillaja saponaria]|uniref:Glycosyltransferase n=1 Tax=Quillaja saponaria TaxID=32244 RepID=A0AAD7KR59_QUISA|nr:Glycosyltransferase [Quillaja saponaria]
MLDHPAIAGLVSHCGWNSILECVTAGLPMITRPLFAEQFYNERLVLDVLKIGVKEWKNLNEVGELVRRETIAKAVKLLMASGEEEAEAMRKKAKELAVGAMKAIHVGGSSHTNLMSLIDELKSLKTFKTHKVTEINVED